MRYPETVVSGDLHDEILARALMERVDYLSVLERCQKEILVSVLLLCAERRILYYNVDRPREVIHILMEEFAFSQRYEV